MIVILIVSFISAAALRNLNLVAMCSVKKQHSKHTKNEKKEKKEKKLVAAGELP